MSSYLYDRSRRGLSLITPPVKEPVSLAQAKKHLRLEIADDDDYVESLVSVARQYVEGYCRRALYKQKWRLTLDRFPTWGDTDDPYFWLYRRGIIELTVPPMIELADFKWIDTQGTERTLAEAFPVAGLPPDAPATAYVNLDIQDESVRLEPVYGQFWPVTQFRIKTVIIDYWTGYTDGVVLPAPPPDYQPPAPPALDPRLPQDGDPLKKIPASIKHAIKLMVGHYYENREPVNIGNITTELPLGVADLLGQYRSIKV